MSQLTEREARNSLIDFERQNSDLPDKVRRLLGLFYLAANRKVPRKAIVNMLGYDSSVVFRDISRRWWLVLKYSDTARLWDGLKEESEKGGLHEGWRYIVDNTTTEERELILKRYGTIPWRATKNSDRSVSGRGRTLRWYKAGTWYSDSVWYKLLVQYESLNHRRIYSKRWHYKVMPYLRALELDCAREVNLDAMSVPTVKTKIKDLVWERLRVLANNPNLSLQSVAWFLTVPVPVSDEYWMAPYATPERPRGADRRTQGAAVKMRSWR